MATGALDANGIWQYGEDDSETTFSALLNKVASSTSTQIGTIKQTGRVLQTVTAKQTGTYSTTSTTTWATTGVTASITPRFSSSKIIVIVQQTLQTINAGQALGATIFRGAVDSGTNFGGSPSGIAGIYSGSVGIRAPGHLIAVDTAGTTSSITYTSAMRTTYGSGTLYAQPDGTYGNIIIMEIAA